MSQRVGVVNLHLAVDMSQDNTMAMLYKIDKGFIQEEHYGLALARVVDLPPEVLEVAETVSRKLMEQVEAKKNSSKSLALAKRRKLVLSLKEALIQAENSPMEGKVLLSWLRKLQEEFIRRMEKIEGDTSSDTEETIADEDEDDQDADEDLEL
jgi:DNA mismatch repair protein MSH4